MKTRLEAFDGETGFPVAGWVWGVAQDGRSRHVQVWTLYAPDGRLTTCKGPWQRFVCFAGYVLDNHGLTHRLDS